MLRFWSGPEYPGSIKLNSRTFLLNPIDTGRPNPLHPSLIVVFGWLNAEPQYLKKYIEPMQKLFPTSSIVVIRSDNSLYFKPESSLETTLAPVVQMLRGELTGPTPTRGILLHTFSNGGGLQVVKLRRVLSRISSASPTENPSPRIPTGLVLDSTPASDPLLSSINTWAPDHPVLHALAVPPIVALYAVFIATNALCGHPPIFRELRETLNTPDLLPTVTPRTDAAATPRLYIYSDGDRVTPAHEVEEHIREARARGFDVDAERFGATPHVAHMRADPERYWRAVVRLWTRVVSASPCSPALASL